VVWTLIEAKNGGGEGDDGEVVSGGFLEACSDAGGTAWAFPAEGFRLPITWRRPDDGRLRLRWAGSTGGPCSR